MAEHSNIPVTIVTGFLGAGKTTFLQYVLTANHGLRIAVIQNELGDEIGGIEQAVVMSAANKAGTESTQLQWLQLPNGCICCSAKDDLIVSLETMLHTPDGSTRFDYVLVELSGLADPGPIAGIFWVDDALESQFFLDAILTFVDARHILELLHEPRAEGCVNEAQRQVAFADRLVVNKRDLVTEQQLAVVRSALRAINTSAPILVSERSRLPLVDVLRLGAFDLRRELLLPPVDSAAPLEPAAACCSAGQHHRHDAQCTSSHRHDDAIVTCSVTHEGEVALGALTNWLGELLWHWPPQIFRCKGVVAVRGEAAKYMLQGVCSLFDLQPADVCWSPGEARVCKLIFVGKGLSSHSLQASFRSALLLDNNSGGTQPGNSATGQRTPHEHGDAERDSP
eukprot:TRINITY_DN23327_c0_g1_i1.p1 TRINITY_DN23327_c0_g1~~TRINITY_DN23327_c0_g1_i1.p1  ORF type:complete len:396 (-),score=95.20 TRINITY_DN23327_c0_g1_i1:140-1327(-)